MGNLSWHRVMQWIGRSMVARHTLAAKLGWTAIAVVAPTALRFLIDGGDNGMPFLTFYPAIVLSALFLGWQFGALTTVLCAAVARLVFMPDGPRLGESAEGIAILGMFALTCAMLVGTAEALRRVFAAASSASERESLLNQELRHRLKNVLALVGSLATLTARHTDPKRAQEAFTERLVALSRAVDLLGSEGPTACGLPELATEALRPFVSDYDLRLSGEPCVLDRDSAVPAVLAFHELATNSIKYGAWSVPDGWVELSWPEPADGAVVAVWRECGGPKVSVPARKGMGTRILSMRSRAAEFTLSYPTEGVQCSIRLRCPAAGAAQSLA